MGLMTVVNKVWFGDDDDNEGVSVSSDFVSDADRNEEGPVGSSDGKILSLLMQLAQLSSALLRLTVSPQVPALLEDDRSSSEEEDEDDEKEDEEQEAEQEQSEEAKMDKKVCVHYCC